MERLTDPAQGYCEMYCKEYSRCFSDPETCVHKAEVAMYEKLKEIEGIVPFERLLELAFADRAGRCVVLPVLPVLRPGCSREEVFILSESGEIFGDNVHEFTIGLGSDGQLKCTAETFDCDDLEINDFGKNVFLTHEAAEAALKQKNE